MYEMLDTDPRYRDDNLPIALERWAAAWVQARDTEESAYVRALAAVMAADYARNIGDFYAANGPDRRVWDRLHRRASDLAAQMDAIDHAPDGIDPEDAARAALDRIDAEHRIGTKDAAAMLGITPRGVRWTAKARRYGIRRGRDLFLSLAEVNAMRDARPGRPRTAGD